MADIFTKQVYVEKVYHLDWSQRCAYQKKTMV